MKKLIEENYKSIVERGLITSETSLIDFSNKIFEELSEFEILFIPDLSYIGIEVEDRDYEDLNKGEKESLSFELADIILTALNCAKHYDIDIEKVLHEKVEINKQRAIEGI